MKNFILGMAMMGVLTPDAISMGRNSNGQGADLGSVVQTEKDLVNTARSLTTGSKPMQLRSKLTDLASNVMRVGNNTAQTYTHPEKAQRAAAAIDGVVNTLGGAALTSTISVINNMRSDLQGYNIPGLFQQYPFTINGQTQSTTMWDSYLYPVIVSHLIRLQAAYATALINYISQNASSLTSDQIDGMINSIGGLINNLSAV